MVAEPLTAHFMKVLASLHLEDQYSFDKPQPPQELNVYIYSIENGIKILGNPQLFNVEWGAAISTLTRGVDFMLSADKRANTAQHVAVYKAIYNVPDWRGEIWDFYTRYTERLLRERSYELDNFMQVDAVREYAPLSISREP